MQDQQWKEMTEFYLGSKTFENKQVIIDKEFIEETQTQTKLYHQYVRSAQVNKKASIIIVHGMGHHSSCFMEVAYRFAKKNYFVHLYDQKGHGYSSGQRYMTTLTDLYENFFAVLTKVRKDLPLFLLTHSMGGGSMLTLLLKNPDLKISGVIFHNPYVTLTNSPPVNFGVRDRVEVALLPNRFENFLMNGSLGAHDLGYGEKFLKRTFEDRFLVPVIGLKIVKTLLKIEKLISQSRKSFTYPSLFLLGERDTIAPMKETHKIFKKIKFKDLTCQQFPSGYHEMIQDEEQEDIVEYIDEWLNQRLNQSIEFEFPNYIDLSEEKGRGEKVKTYLLILAVLFLLWRKRPELFHSLYQILTFNKSR